MHVVKTIDVLPRINGTNYIKIRIDGTKDVSRWLNILMDTGELIKDVLFTNDTFINIRDFNDHYNKSTKLCYNMDQTIDYLKEYFSAEDYLKIEKEILEQCS